MHKDPGEAGPLHLNRKLNSVFEGFERTRLDHLARGLGLEHCLLFREGIDTFAFRHGGLRDRGQFYQTRQHNFIFGFELFVNNIVESIHNGIDLFLL